MTRYLHYFLYTLFLFGFIGFSFAQDPSFSLDPWSGQQLKLHCTYDINLRLNSSWQRYNAFQSTLKFNTSDSQIITWSVNAPFTDYQVSQIEWWNRYRMWGNFAVWQSWTWDISAATFGFKTISNILSTTLEFVNIDWGPISYWLGWTDDGQFIIGVDANGDILASVVDATYNFVTWPCTIDTNAPNFTSLNPSANSNIPLDQTISFLTYDWVGWTNHYWYSWQEMLLSNYVLAPTTVDNQWWVNSGTIKATVSCPTCSTSWSYVLSGSSLNITDWNWDWSRNQLTWNNNRRWYNVSFDPPAPYEIEKRVSVVLNSTDNPNESWNVNTWTSATYYFNNPVKPTITEISHINWSTFVSPSKSLPIKFKFSDTWAGIDTGSIKIDIPTILSWATQLLTGYIYSWSDLTITLSGWAEGIGNSGSYVVEFLPNWDFPANTLVTINTFVDDLAWSTWSRVTTFTTRPDCTYFGCSEILNINILEWINLGNFVFTWTTLIVTGTNTSSPYPYLTGISNDILVCWYEWTWAILTGNVQIYDSSDNIINGSVYSGNALYITGLNFTIVDGVIVVQ